MLNVHTTITKKKSEKQSSCPEKAKVYSGRAGGLEQTDRNQRHGLLLKVQVHTGQIGW